MVCNRTAPKLVSLTKLDILHVCLSLFFTKIRRFFFVTFDTGKHISRTWWIQTFITNYYFYYYKLLFLVRVDVRKDQTVFRISGKPLWGIDFAHTFKIESAMSSWNYGIVRLVKYCFILEKNANYKTPLKMSIRRAIFGFTLVIRCGKLIRLSPKITLNSYQKVSWLFFGRLSE